MIQEIIMSLIVIVPVIALSTVLLRFIGRIYWKTQIMKLKETKQTKAIFWKNLIFGEPPLEYLVLTGRISKEDAAEMMEKEVKESEPTNNNAPEFPLSDEQMEIVLRRKPINGSEENQNEKGNY